MKTIEQVLEYLEKELQNAEKQIVVSGGAEYAEGVYDAYDEILSYIKGE